MAEPTQADKDFMAWHAFHQGQLDAISLPEALRRKLWQKLSFEDFDMGTCAKIIVDENKERTELMATKNLAKDSDVYLIDHAWTFHYQNALSTLLENPQLVERLEKMTEDCYKLDLPEQEEEEKKEDDQDKAQTVFQESLDKGGKVFDLDNLGITSLN